jgi:dTMP kinase
MALNGILISFEGTEGSGKSTLIRQVAASLEKQNLSTVVTREPGGNPLAEKIRSILLNHEMDPMTELFLYEAARAEHLAQTILPGLKAGKFVLCDRFTDSTLAYQAQARGLPWKKVEILNRIATGGIQPRLTVFLDIDPETGLKRAQDPNRFEAEGVNFQTQVRAGFLKARAQAKKSSKCHWLTLKVEGQTPEQLSEKVMKMILKLFRTSAPLKSISGGMKKRG